VAASDKMASKVKQKTCECCGKIFLCEEGGCWCSKIELSPAAREEMQRKFKDCICESCLRAMATSPRLQ